MPISIAGSGTITGISAGGLPDDCITTAEIAANAVTNGKLGANERSGLAKAWVNFNGTGTVAIRASYNVSSITDNGTGDYTVNFTTALADADYAVGSMAAGPSDPYRQASFRGSVSPTTTQLRVATYNASGTGLEDASIVTLCVFR
jgi:hypothetical protein